MQSVSYQTPTIATSAPCGTKSPKYPLAIRPFTIDENGKFHLPDKEDDEVQRDVIGTLQDRHSDPKAVARIFETAFDGGFLPRLNELIKNGSITIDTIGENVKQILDSKYLTLTQNTDGTIGITLRQASDENVLQGIDEAFSQRFPTELIKIIMGYGAPFYASTRITLPYLLETIQSTSEEGMSATMEDIFRSASKEGKIHLLNAALRATIGKRAEQAVVGTTFTWSGMNLAGLNLSGIRLDSVRLVDVNLEGADLSKAELRNVVIVNANITGAVFTQTQFFATTISNTFICSDADLTQTKFVGSKFVASQIESASLSKARFINVVFSHSPFGAGTILHDVGFQDATFTDSPVKSAKISGISIFQHVVFERSPIGPSAIGAKTKFVAVNFKKSPISSAEELSSSVFIQVVADVESAKSFPPLTRMDLQFRRFVNALKHAWR